MYELITYGAGEQLWELFNGIAAAVGDNGYLNILQIAILFAFLMGLTQVVFSLQIKGLMHWFFVFFLTFNIMFVPKVDLLITDRADSDRQYIVANVPFGLAFFVDIFSSVGDTLTRLTESVFTQPNDLKYSQSGTLMAASLIQTASRYQITNFEFSQSMKSYVHQCVQYDLLLNRYTLDDIFHQGDLWAFFEANASKARSFMYKNPDTGEETIMTCENGIVPMRDDWNNELDRAIPLYAKHYFGDRYDAQAKLMSLLPLSYEYLSGISESTGKIMQQNMLVNAVRDGVFTRSGESGAAAAAQSYGSTRALQQQRASWGIGTRMASYTLPLLLNVIEVIVYGAFLLVLPLMLLPGAWAMIRYYIMTMLWVQTWGPLYAVLNLFMNIEARKPIMSLAATSAEINALTIANLPGIEQLAADRMLIAGYFGLAIPLLSFGLIVSGRMMFSHLSMSITGGMQSAASQAGEEMASSNYNAGNVSAGTRNLYNDSGYHTNRNFSHASGMVALQTPTGSKTTLAPDGKWIGDNTGAVSSLNTQANYSDRLTQTASNAYEDSISAANAQSAIASNAETAMHKEIYEFGRAHSDGSYRDSMSSMGQSHAAVNNAVQYANMVDSVQKSYGANTDDYSTRSMSGQLGGGAGGSISKGGQGSSASGNISGRIGGDISVGGGVTGTSSERHAESQDYSLQNNMGTTLDAAVRASQDESFKNSSEESMRLSENIATLQETAATAREEEAVNLQQAEAWKEVLSSAQEKGLGLNTNMTQFIFDEISQQINPDTGRAYGPQGAVDLFGRDIEKAHELSESVLNNFAKNVFEEMGVDKEHIKSAFADMREEVLTQAREEMAEKYAQGQQEIDAKAEEQEMQRGVTDDVNEKIKGHQATVEAGINEQATEIKQGRERAEIVADNELSRSSMGQAWRKKPRTNRKDEKNDKEK